MQESDCQGQTEQTVDLVPENWSRLCVRIWASGREEPAKAARDSGIRGSCPYGALHSSKPLCENEKRDVSGLRIVVQSPEKKTNSH